MLKLSQLNNYIKQVLSLNFEQVIDLEAEIHQANEARGHWYIELVEKSDRTDEVVARQSAVIWRSTVAILFRKHGNILEDLLQRGNHISLKCVVDYHIKYGLKLMIQDIDPSFTLGQLEITRQQTLQYIRENELIGKNAALPRPMYFERMAVITSRTAAGWADFSQQLLRNEVGIGFDIHLYHASVQGAQAVPEILENLRRIEKDKHLYDCVCILRGGGSRLDLAAFDDRYLAEAIAGFPITILTGLGHETDVSIADMVAGMSLKTPTALANHILSENYKMINYLDQLDEDIKSTAWHAVRDAREMLRSIHQTIGWSVRMPIRQQLISLERLRESILRAVSTRINNNRHFLEVALSVIDTANPAHILKRGYAFVKDKSSGDAIISAKSVDAGKEIEITWHDGAALGTIDKIKKK